MTRMAPSAVLFDLDGTLVDSLVDLTTSVNRALELHGLPTHPAEAYRGFVGDGVKNLIARAMIAAGEPARGADAGGGAEAWPADAGRFESVLEAHLTWYDDHAFEQTRPYEGVLELLDGLAARGLVLAVLSNKRDTPTRKVVRHFFGDRFADVRGELPGTPRKPDPTAALEIAAGLLLPQSASPGVRPERCLFVGDTRFDVETAVAAGMTPVGVLWGFRGREELEAAGARHVISHPTELLPLVDDGAEFPG